MQQPSAGPANPMADICSNHAALCTEEQAFGFDLGGSLTPSIPRPVGDTAPPTPEGDQCSSDASVGE